MFKIQLMLTEINDTINNQCATTICIVKLTISFNTKQKILLSRKLITLPKHSVKHPSPTIYTKGIVLRTRGE
jgi:hypothetical protein